MPIPIHIKTHVLPGGRIEISDPAWSEGSEVDILLTIQSAGDTAEQIPSHAGKALHVLDIVAAIPPQRTFQTSEEVERYLEEERDAWDQ